MENISYHKATPDDIETLVEYRTRFAIELKGERPLEEINNLIIMILNIEFNKIKVCFKFKVK